MKVIMYHYVREYSSALPNFRFLDIKNFSKQLDYFEENYGFASREDWNKAIESKKLGSIKGKVLLTFDDAMSCNFDYVFPELQRRDLWGIFYVPAQPYISGKMLDVHRINLLCGAFDGKRLLTILLGIVKDEMIPYEKKDEFRNKTYLSHDNYEGISEFKRILNYYVSYEHREFLIDKISEELGYKFDFRDFYVSIERLKEMSNCGNVIGAHTVSHPVMSKLSRKDQNFQIRTSFKFLESIQTLGEKTYCHPYGGSHTFNDETIEILNSENVNYSFSVEPRDIEDVDFSDSIQFLPRYDCNKFPFGAAS